MEASRAGVVRFTLLDTAGKPVDNAIFVTLLEDTVSCSMQVTSPSAGVYEARLEAGSAVVSVGRYGLASSRVTVDVKEGATTEVKVILQPKAE